MNHFIQKAIEKMSREIKNSFIGIKLSKRGVWDTTQPVKYLLHKNEHLSLIPRTYVKSWAWWCVLLILALGRGGQEEPWS